MKTLILFIMAFLFSNLNAFAGVGLSADDQTRWDLDQVKYSEWQTANPGMSYREYNKKQADIAPCTHCPAPYALLSSILPILKSLPNAGSLQPVGDLQLQYAQAQISTSTGESCKNIYQSYDERYEKKILDGGLIEVAGGILSKYSSVTHMTYARADLKSASYFYRDGANHVVQVIVDREGKASFKYFEYTPNKIAKSRVNLPDLAETPESIMLAAPSVPTQTAIHAPSKTADGLEGHYSGSLQAEVIKSHGVLKFLPTDVHLFNGEAGVSLGGAATVTGTASTSLAKGNNVDISVVTGADQTQNALIRYNVATTIDGKFKSQTVTVPVSVTVGTALGINGSVSDTRSSGGVPRTQAMVMDFFEPAGGENNARKEYVTLAVNQAQGQRITYDVKRTFNTGDSIFTTSAGHDTVGGFVGVGYSPTKNPDGAVLQLKVVDEVGRVAGYVTYSQAFK